MPSESGMLSQIFSRISSTVQTKISSISKLTNKIQNFSNNIIQKIQEKATEFLNIMTAKPKSKADYWKIAGVYFAKKFVITSFFVLGALAYVYVNVVIPNFEGKLWHAKLNVNSNKAQQFSGKAKIYDIDGTFIYQGEMNSGTPNGSGTQYDLDGRLIYKGQFKGGRYNGVGELYDPSSGKLIYSGNFENNKYEGIGQLLNSFGKVTYSGNFKSGMKSGKGTEYDPKSGFKKYYGEFENGKYEGKGVVYNANETITYEGDFKDGLFDGQGKKYQNGHLIYDGGFKAGKYSGSGILHDEASGNIIYSGEFSEGSYSGSGKLYDNYSFKIAYEGEFENGKKSGNGTLYDKLGVPVFSGEFKDNAINYMGNFGLTLDKFIEKFGQYTSQIVSDGKKILLYSPIDSAMVFEENEDGEYVFTRVILGTKNEFMGIGKESSVVERRNILGQAFVSTDYNLKSYQKSAFSVLKINIDKNYLIPTDKYIFEKYFIRFFMNPDRSEIQAIEVGRL